MDSTAAREILDREVGRLRDRAIISTNPDTIAQAIAISDQVVQTALLEKLVTGRRITDISVQDDVGGKKLVFFLVHEPDAPISVTKTGLLAIVDLGLALVTGTVDPHTYCDYQREWLPFVVAASEPLGDITMDPQFEEKEEAFRRQIMFAMRNRPPVKIAPPTHGHGGGAYGGKTTTPSPTVSYSGGKDDDTKVDYPADTWDSFTSY